MGLWIGLFALVLTIVGLIVAVIFYLYPRSNSPSRNKEGPVVLSSERIDLGSGTKKAINNFFVRNIGEVDLYQVTIKLLLDSAVLSVTNDDIRVEMINPPSNAEMPIPIYGDPFSQALVASHGMVIPGRDASNREAFWIMVNHLAPKASVGFRIRNQSFKILPTGKHCFLTSVSFFTNTLPASLMFDDGSPGFITPRSDSMGIKSIGPGKGSVMASMHTTQIDGADIVSNATCLIEAGKWDEAEKELTRAIQQNPSLGVAYHNRSTLLGMRGRPQEGYQDALKALSLLPDDPLVHATLANCLRLLGRKDEALTNFTAAVILAGTNMPNLFYERGVLLSELNRLVEARREFDQAILLGYTNEWSYYSRGVTFLNEHSFSNAVSDFSIAIVKRPDMVEAYIARGIAFEGAGQSGMASKDIREAIRLNPSLTNIFKTK